MYTRTLLHEYSVCYVTMCSELCISRCVHTPPNLKVFNTHLCIHFNVYMHLNIYWLSMPAFKSYRHLKLNRSLVSQWVLYSMSRFHFSLYLTHIQCNITDLVEVLSTTAGEEWRVCSSSWWCHTVIQHNNNLAAPGDHKGHKHWDWRSPSTHPARRMSSECHWGDLHHHFSPSTHFSCMQSFSCRPCSPTIGRVWHRDPRSETDGLIQIVVFIKAIWLASSFRHLHIFSLHLHSHRNSPQHGLTGAVQGRGPFPPTD